MTPQQLKHIAPHLTDDKVNQILLYLTPAMDSSQINTPQRQAAFIAQGAHETGGFVFFKELWGPTPQQLKYDPPNPLAQQLGNTTAGDGFKYRGRGMFQITGKANYTKYGKIVNADFINHPELASDFAYAFKTAAIYWNDHDLSSLADLDSLDGFKQITKKINGGYTGLDDRLAYWAKAKEVLYVQS